MSVGGGSECDVVEERQILTFKPYLGLCSQNNSVVITTEGSSTKSFVIIIGASLSEPHTSGTALHCTHHNKTHYVFTTPSNLAIDVGS